MAKKNDDLEATRETSTTIASTPSICGVYEPPQVRELGTLLDLTEGGRGGNIERALGSH